MPSGLNRRSQNRVQIWPNRSVAVPGGFTVLALLQPFSQPPILRLQLANQLDELPPLVAQKRKLLNLFSADERADIVNVVSRPLGQFVDPGGKSIRLHSVQLILAAVHSAHYPAAM